MSGENQEHQQEQKTVPQAATQADLVALAARVKKLEDDATANKPAKRVDGYKS